MKKTMKKTRDMASNQLNPSDEFLKVWDFVEDLETESQERGEDYPLSGIILMADPVSGTEGISAYLRLNNPDSTPVMVDALVKAMETDPDLCVLISHALTTLNNKLGKK